MRSDRAILLVNVGSVSEPTVKGVRAFLREFLSDRHVLKMPAWKRWLLLHAIILRFRPEKIAPMYQRIWGQNDASPLLRASAALQQALQDEVGDGAHVVLAMRYGEPSLTEAVRKLKRLRIRQLAVFPLYPQYAEATTLSSLRAVERCLAREKLFFQTSYNLAPFYAATGYIDALYAGAQKYLAKGFDRLIFSFHSLPRTKAAERYHEQCLSTVDAFCKRANISRNDVDVCFQSRFGRGDWLGPDTVAFLEQLPEAGYRRVTVICPSFVCDGLESLYEMGETARSAFFNAGGTQFTLVPCLNAQPEFVKFLAQQSLLAWRE